MTEYLYILPEGVLGILNPKTPRYSCKYRRDTLPLGTAICMTRCSRGSGHAGRRCIDIVVVQLSDKITNHSVILL